jgi:hypothetical protein
MDEWWLIAVPSAVLYAVPLVYALGVWVRQPHTRYLNRWVWLPIIILFSILGPLAFLLLGSEKGLAEQGGA